MKLALHNLKPASGSKKKRKRVGRGNASGHGTYSTRGLKGQRSRSGGKSGLKRLGFKANLQNIKKLRGFTSIRTPKHEVKLSDLNVLFASGETVSPKTLQEKGFIKSTKPGVKILSNGELKQKLTIKNCSVSAQAKEKIEAAGGSVA